MSINDRIRQIRLSERMTQAEFAKALGLKQNTVSRMEKEGNTVVDQNKKIICEKFLVNKDWLETGTGDMHMPGTVLDAIDNLRDKYHMTEIEERLLRAYFQLSEESRARACDFIRRIGATEFALWEKAAEEQNGVPSAAEALTSPLATATPEEQKELASLLVAMRREKRQKAAIEATASPSSNATGKKAQ